MGENNHQEDPPRSNSHSSSQHEHESSTSTVAINNGIPSSTHQQQQYTVEYLSQLLKDKKQLAAFPNVFHHVERLVDEEIGKVRIALFQFEFSKDQLALPDAEGELQTITEKVFVPAKEHPDYNFVGRILGPRGMTAKQLEQETGCKIMVRGRGSMRDKKKEEMNRGKPNWEHLNEELHVLIQCEDAPNRAQMKMLRAVQEVRKLLVPAAEGEDELKRKQLMELAIINGTYRPANHQGGVKVSLPTGKATDCLMSPATMNGQLRSPSLAGAPIILSPSGRAAAASAVAAAQLQQSHHHHLLAGFPVSSAGASGLQLMQAQQQAQQLDYASQFLLNSMQLDPATAAALGMGGLQAVNATNYQQYAAAAAMLGAASQQQMFGADYSAIDLSGAMLCNQRRILGQTRDHPYQTSGKTSTS